MHGAACNESSIAPLHTAAYFLNPYNRYHCSNIDNN
jgi:hypothetical protein